MPGAEGVSQRWAVFLQETSSLVADLRAESAHFESGFTETKQALDTLQGIMIVVVGQRLVQIGRIDGPPKYVS